MEYCTFSEVLKACWMIKEEKLCWHGTLRYKKKNKTQKKRKVEIKSSRGRWSHFSDEKRRRRKQQRINRDGFDPFEWDEKRIWRGVEPSTACVG